MKKVTSVTIFETSVGTKMAITYSEVDEAGNIIKENERIQKIVMNLEAKEHIEAVNTVAQAFVDAE